MDAVHQKEEGYNLYMARYTGPRARVCRRLEFPVFESPKFSSPRKNYPPGEHGNSRRRKPSNYGIQLREKQRIKYLYGVLEKQFRNYFKKAANKKGAAFSIVDKKYHTSDKIIKVKDTLGFLTNVSRKIKQVSNINSIAITGSSGKTSLKEILYFCFQKYYHTTSSIKSFNNHIGVPLSLFNIKNERFGIFEVGMDKKGEIDSLSKIINPNLAVITNVTYAHAKNFKGLHEIALAKSEIIQNIKNEGTVVLNRDDKFWNLFKKIALKKKLKIISFSKKDKKANIVFLSIV